MPSSRLRSAHLRPGWTLLACAAVLVVWIGVLAETLGSSTTVRHWNITWIGLAALEVVGLAATAVCVIVRARALTQAATATATLLLVDAWFDVTLSPPGVSYAESLLLAVVVEIPLAALCLRLARRPVAR